MPSDGFLNLLKPPGLTSHDLVAFTRRLLGMRRVGHLGTLDPAAAGVLPMCFGRATRLFDFVEGTKAYRAEIRFGVTTDTLDAEGRVTATADASGVTAEALRARLADLLGEQQQAPPAFSAAQVGGKRLHELARRGQPVQAAARTVHFYALELLDFQPGLRARAWVDVACSAGTYIRVLADDLGRAFGCGAFLAFLLRTRAGRFSLAEAWTLEEASSDLPEARLPIDWPLEHLPRVTLPARDAGAFVSGTSAPVEMAPAWPVRVYDEYGTFLGLGDAVPGRLQPRLILAVREELRS